MNKTVCRFEDKNQSQITVGQIIDQVYKRIAYESIIGTARAAIAAMTNHRGIRTRPSTLSIGQGRSAN